MGDITRTAAPTSAGKQATARRRTTPPDKTNGTEERAASLTAARDEQAGRGTHNSGQKRTR